MTQIIRDIEAHTELISISDTGKLIRCDDDGNLCAVPPSSGLPYRFFLTENGNGSGEFNLNGNYSGSPLTAFYEATQRYELYSLLICISDDAKFNQSDYGAITAGTIVNGVKFFIQPAGRDDIKLLTNIGITKNYEWLAITPETNLTSFDGTPQTLTINVDIYKQYGKPLRMNAGDRLKVVLADDYSGLVSHTFGIRGTLF